MKLGVPFLYLGPGNSHIGDLLEKGAKGTHLPLGQVDRLVEEILKAEQESQKGCQEQPVLADDYSVKKLCPKLVKTLCEI